MIRVEISAKGIFDDSNNLIELEGLVADVTEKHRMLEELTQMARVDALTGLWNRRYFVELGLREVARAKRGGIPVGHAFFLILIISRPSTTPTDTRPGMLCSMNWRP